MGFKFELTVIIVVIHNLKITLMHIRTFSTFFIVQYVDYHYFMFHGLLILHKGIEFPDEGYSL